MRSHERLWPFFAGPVVTLALSFGWTLDSVNTIKLLALGLVAGFALSEISSALQNSYKFLLAPEILVSLFFLLGLFAPIIFADSPIAQQIYGTSGRNLGFLHYFFLTIILVGVSTLRPEVVLHQILSSLVALGIVEASYGLLQFLNFDPLPWSNPNHWIFGTFGNPNYLSSFLSFSAIATLAVALSNNKKLLRCVLFGTAVFQGGVILLTDSSQGLILLCLGLFSLTILFLFNRSKALGFVAVIITLISTILAFLGIFQKGPLQSFLYQPSISYRGDYWRSGIRMFQENWLHGVGLDSYGDYYRMYRDDLAAYRRGLEVVSNSAHNLFIDLAAAGGIFLLCGYLLILGLVVRSIVCYTKRVHAVTIDFKVLVILWVLFILQTFISVNVPSLAIWGWLFSGILIAFGKEVSIVNPSWRKVSHEKPRTSVALAYCLVFTLFVSPLINRDVKLEKSLSSGEPSTIVSSFLLFPRDADQIARMAIAFEESGYVNESLSLARGSVSENANSSRAWQVILESPNVDSTERESAREAMSRLDPYFEMK